MDASTAGGGEAEEARPLRSFTDGKRRKWTPRINCNALRIFEETTGRGVLEELFAAAGSAQEEEVAVAHVAKIAAQLLGNVGHLMVLLYEALRPSPGQELQSYVPNCPEETGVRVTFADFCASIGEDEVGPALSCAIVHLLEFFPDLSDLGKLAPKEGRRPFLKGEAGRGSESTSSQAPRE